MQYRCNFIYIFIKYFCFVFTYLSQGNSYLFRMTSKERTISYFQLKPKVIAKIAQLNAVDFDKRMLSKILYY